MAVAAAPLPPPAIVSPAPREVSYGRIEGRAPSGTRQVLVRVGGRLLATKNVTRRRFVVVVSLPSRDVTIRVTAIDARGPPLLDARRARLRPAARGGSVRRADPRSPRPRGRGARPGRRARLARRFPGVCGVFVQDLRTGAGAAWNARARFPAASTLKLAIAVELMRSLKGIPAPGSRLASLLWRMLVYSDDRSANELLAAIGGSTSGGSARVNSMMRALNLADSEMYGGYIVENSLERRPIPLEILGRPYFIGKYTTAWDLARLERALHLAAGARGALVWRFRGAFSPGDARFLLYLLAHSRTRGGLTPVWGRRRHGAPQGRAGSRRRRHDSGLVYSSGGAFVVTVLTWNGGGVGSASDLLATRVAQAAIDRLLH